MWTEVYELAELLKSGQSTWEDLDLDDVDVRLKVRKRDSFLGEFSAFAFFAFLFFSSFLPSFSPFCHSPHKLNSTTKNSGSASSTAGSAPPENS